MPPPESDRLIRAVGRRIAELRVEAGLTQGAFAEKLRVSTNYVRLLERGAQNLTLVTLARLSKGLGVPVAALLVPPRTLRAAPGRPRSRPER